MASFSNKAPSVVVGDHFEIRAALEVVRTLLNRPNNCQTLQLDSGLAGLTRGEAARATVYHPVLPIGLPLEERKPKAMEARSICKQLGLEVYVEGLDHHGRA